MTNDRTSRRVVCAAVKFSDGLIVTGPRHFDNTMHAVISRVGFSTSKHCADAEQGFVDQWGRFMTREEAFIVAWSRGQFLAKSETPGVLFSEDLY